MAETITPATFEEAAAALAGAAAAPRPVRITGSGTKLGWGGSAPRHALRLQTTALSRTLEYSPADLTATFEAGAPLAVVRRELARRGQMLALDPPLGAAPGATIGGIFATGDAGPLSHRYGTPRDLVLGMTVALSDGTIAHAGGRVMKNVAGYDLSRLFTGAFGTLGAILAVSVRLHPRGAGTATALGAGDDPEALRECALELAAAPFELDALDVAWRDGRGGLLARVRDGDAAARAERVASVMRSVGLHGTEVRTDDESLWARQRSGQRSADRAVARISARPSQLAEVLTLAQENGGTVVGRAAGGLSYLTVNVNRVAPLRAGLPDGARLIVLDLPVAARGAVETWDAVEGPELELMRAVKHRFDPAGICNPGVFAGGL